MSNVKRLYIQDVKKLINSNLSFDTSLILAIHGLALHNPLEDKEIKTLLVIREGLLNQYERDKSYRLHHDIDMIKPFQFLEDGAFIIEVGKRQKIVDEHEIEGSTKSVCESILITEKGKVHHTIKLCPLKHAENLDMAQGYLIREYYSLRLFHGSPYVVQCYTLFETYDEHDNLCIANLQEAYEGSIIRLFYATLDFLAQESGILFIKHFISIFYGFTSGLVELHQYGVHGDISPANIFYKSQESGIHTGVLADLEAYDVGESIPRAFEAASQDLVAPEIEDYVTRESDIYALGSVMMLVRNRFVTQVIASSISDQKQQLDACEKMIDDIFTPLGINSLIEQMRGENPKIRPTAQDVVECLKQQMLKLNIPLPTHDQ